MYISQISIKGYKNTCDKSAIPLNKGLNVLLGENGCGKTAVINAMRLLFREADSYYAFSTDDFYSSLDRTATAAEIEIDADLLELSENEKLTFLSWCDADFNAHLHLRISENTTKPGVYKRKYWGGYSSASIFEEDTFDKIECIYLPPLRDAEARLSAGRRSRLAALLKKQYGTNTDNFVNSVTDFNNRIIQNVDGQHSEITSVKSAINKKVLEALGKQLGQSINLQFTETSFNKIVESIRMVFFPHSGETDVEKFRDLATNSLGYNNLLYIATVFSELELIKDSDVFTVLLIEEPEAHLHPQLQVKFIKYLEGLAASLQNAQAIVSTHSPVLASSVGINKLIHLVGTSKSISATALCEKNFNNTFAEGYINRWMDTTKSTMLFSRGVILVEGIAEALLLPKLAEIVLNDYNHAHAEDTQVASTLDEMGISVININGINFQYFMKLFGNFGGSSGPSIPMYCAGITDRDPGKEIFPCKGDTVVCYNPIHDCIAEINANDNLRIFISPWKTFEYDLAILNPVPLAVTLQSLWPAEDGRVSSQLGEIINRNGKYTDQTTLAEDAKYIYTHIDSSSIGKGVFSQVLVGNVMGDFVVPPYIKNAILWACGGICDE